MINFSIDDCCWQLADGRIWSTAAAAYVDDMQAQEWVAAHGLDSTPPGPPDEAGKSTEEGLRAALRFYQLPMGELTPAPSTDDLKSALRSKRKEVEYGGFMLDGQLWDSSEKDELRLNSVGKLFESGLTEYDGWKVAEGTYITLTPELLQKASFALMTHYSRAFATEAAKLAEIDALKSPEERKKWLENELNRGW